MTRRVLAPLAWLVVLVPAAVAWTLTDLAATSAPLVPAGRALAVEAEVGDDDDGGGPGVPVRYRNPMTGQVVDLRMAVFRDELRPAPGTRVEVLVDRHDPDAVMVRGDREPASWRLAEYLWLPAIPLAVAGARWLFARRVGRLVRRDAPTFSMLAHVTGSRVGVQRLVHLYPLDAPAGSRPLCTVPVLPWTSGVPASRTFLLEVKGSPRPFGLVVARAGRHLLWPTGPARTAARVSRPARAGDQSDLTGDPRDDGPPAATLLDPALLVLVCLAAVAVAASVVVATLVRADARADLVRDGVPVVVEVTGVRDGGAALGVRYADADGGTRTATAERAWPRLWTTGRLYPAVVPDDGGGGGGRDGDGGRVELLADDYDPVDPIVWGALVPAAAGALVVRRRIYAGPRS